MGKGRQRGPVKQSGSSTPRGPVENRGRVFTKNWLNSLQMGAGNTMKRRGLKSKSFSPFKI